MRSKRVLGLICVAFTLFLLNQGALTFAEGSTEFSIDVSSAALQLTVPPTASIELNPTTSSAVFGSTNVTINVATNNIAGYRIIMSVPSTNLTHNSLSNTVIPTLSAASTESNFPANAWGYKVVGDDYEPILTSNTPASWVVEEPTNGTNHTMTLAAKVDGTKPSGNYTNTLTFQAVANPNAPKDTIVYNGNGADGGSMANQQIWQGEYSKLAKNTYTKSGYLFNGWNTKNDGKGAGYGDEDNFITPATNTATTITLYAQWIEDTGQGSGNVGKTLQDAYEMAYVTNPGNFQEGGNNKHGLYVPEKDPVTGDYTGEYFEATKASDYEGIPANDLRFAIQDISLEINGVKICDYATVIGSTAYVLDLRDFNSYHIVKAKDGRCWMADNLAINPADATTKARMNDSNTNAPAEALQAFLYGTNTGITGYARSAVVNTDSRWNGNNNNYYTPILSTSRVNTVASDNQIQHQWKTGVFYNYCAASAGTYCYEYGAGPNKSNTAIDSPYDICPASWRLPTGGQRPVEPTGVESGPADGGEWRQVYYSYKQYSNSTLEDHISLRNTLRITYSGYATNTSADGQTFYTWTASHPEHSNNAGSAMEYAELENNVMSSQGGYAGRVAGYSVRCVAK